MELTPIKVKGKRKNRNSATRPAYKIQNAAASGSSTRTSAKDNTVAVQPKSKSNKSRRKVSLLEQLPTEILQRIFLFCINLELPRTSFILRDKLSTEIVYLRTVQEGFGPSWSDLTCHVLPKSESPFRIPRNGSPILQSAILRCRWATFSILRKAEASFFKQMYETSIGDWVDWSGRKDGIPHGDPSTFANSTLSELASIREKGFEDDYQHLLALNNYIILSSEGSEEEFSWRHKFYLTNNVSHYSTLLSHIDTCVPTSLLRGPWTEDMIKHLFWILRTVGISDRKTAFLLLEQKPIDLEAAYQGIEEAINTLNLAALRMLTTYAGAQCLDHNLFKRAAMLEAPKNCGITAHLINITRIIPFDEDLTPRYKMWAHTYYRRELEKLQVAVEKRPIRDPERQPLIDWYEKMIRYGEDMEFIVEEPYPDEDLRLPSLFEGGPDVVTSSLDI